MRPPHERNSARTSTRVTAWCGRSRRPSRETTRAPGLRRCERARTVQRQSAEPGSAGERNQTECRDVGPVLPLGDRPNEVVPADHEEHRGEGRRGGDDLPLQPEVGQCLVDRPGEPSATRRDDLWGCRETLRGQRAVREWMPGADDRDVPVLAGRSRRSSTSAARSTGADTGLIDGFLASLAAGVPPIAALAHPAVPKSVGRFVRHTLQVALDGAPHEVASSFCHGRGIYYPTCSLPCALISVTRSTRLRSSTLPRQAHHP